MNETLVIVTPVFNDWDSFRILTTHLSQLGSQHKLKIQILAIDDGSSVTAKTELLPTENLKGIEIIRLTINLGHQRAIAVGLVEAEKI